MAVRPMKICAHHPLSGPQVPDVATDRLNHAHTVGAGRELRRCFIVTATAELLASNPRQLETSPAIHL
jgi:hypothetical protein